MSQIDLFNVILTVISLFLSIFIVHYIFFGIVGLFKVKKFKRADRRLCYGVLISARNEEKVISDLICSINEADYPHDKIKVFVVAHNCTDNTAEIARSCGAEVFEYDNENEKTKGYALKFLCSAIIDKYGKNAFDGFFVFDADNVIPQNFIDKMNDAFCHYDGKNIITGYRNAKNFGHSTLTALYGLLFGSACLLEGRGRTYLNCSTRTTGTGFLFPSDIVNDGWNYVGITEDIEFSAEQIISGREVCYCEEAVFYDEQPTSFSVSVKQRLRWEKGLVENFKTKLSKTVKGVFTKDKKKNKLSVLLMAIYLLTPALIVINAIIFIAKFILIGVASFMQASSIPLINHLVLSGIWILGAYLSWAMIAMLTYIFMREKIGKIKIKIKVLSILFYPLFVSLSLILVIVAIFKKKVVWKQIPHGHAVNVKKIKTAENVKK